MFQSVELLDRTIIRFAQPVADAWTQYIKSTNFTLAIWCAWISLSLTAVHAFWFSEITFQSMLSLALISPGPLLYLIYHCERLNRRTGILTFNIMARFHPWGMLRTMFVLLYALSIGIITITWSNYLNTGNAKIMAPWGTTYTYEGGPGTIIMVAYLLLTLAAFYFAACTPKAITYEGKRKFAHVRAR
jgi:hypothetical protein